MQPLEVDEPTAVGPYRLLGRLGSGGMGRVYLGRSAGGRTVAVKIVHPHFALDEEFRARFRREVEAARRVGGAWTAPVLDADPGAPVPWVATAYAAGPSLAAAVTDGGPLPAHSVRALGSGLAEALAAVHELGLVHRDVKPSNVLLTLDGPLLIDFGIARATDGTASLTSTGVSIGSPGYMSPEQILGRGATGAADVFSLGAVLAYAATGTPPFPGDSSAALLYKVVHEEPELGALEGDMRDLVAACLAKDPAARPAPAGIARRLAPEGTARLVAGGWLPGRLVEQVSRGAVRLLNLEAAGEAPGSQGASPEGRSEPGGASGPVGFSSVSVASERPSDTGRFGPPPVMPGTAPPAPAPTPPPTAPPFGVPEPRDAPPQESVAAGVTAGAGAPDGADGADGRSGPGKSGAGPSGSGRFSVTVAAGSAPGDGGRGRRMSCSVVLAVAGALAVVTTVGGVLLSQLHGDSGKDGASSGAPPGSTGTRPSASAAATGAVPEVYLGTWRGDGTVTALGQDLPGGTYEIVVRQGAPGSVVGSVTQTDALGGACVDELTLKSATATELVATGRGRKDNPSHCVPDAHEVRLRPDGGNALRFTSVDPKAGNPKARLLRAD
ncbi:serine/threonine-protein kinase [Streptomyces naganishii]|uniref:Serine/threonine protein kinase n=1 Tax=Streptomyces naganishii JCM 4654 TaxID=1306179 RepID=A0A919CZA6_9ACTN|nr:serine/threonine-protein kinase [Streptomyces naganishii]GHD93995.1 serine/threonine protein kinase [Streptomyces naganishii JCM 4654]